MKSTIYFSVPKTAKVLVSAGSHITSKTALAEIPYAEKTEIVPVAEILGVKKEDILKYFKKAVGEEITKGETLAEKKAVFSSCLIKSPFSGKLKEINLISGTLSLTIADSAYQPQKIYLPIEGKVKSVTKGIIEIEIEGKTYKTAKGHGKEALGKLVYFGKKSLDVLGAINHDLENSIVVCYDLDEAAEVKLEVLGVLGLILGKSSDKRNLPWVEIEEEVLLDLKEEANKNVWLRPSEKQLVILE